jgi:hypothetical protein
LLGKFTTFLPSTTFFQTRPHFWQKVLLFTTSISKYSKKVGEIKDHFLVQKLLGTSKNLLSISEFTMVTLHANLVGFLKLLVN